MEWLPLDIHVLLLSRLSPEEIVSLGRVSRAWLRASRHSSLWIRICAERGLQDGSLARYRHLVSARGRSFDQRQILMAMHRLLAASNFFGNLVFRFVERKSV